MWEGRAAATHADAQAVVRGGPLPFPPSQGPHDRRVKGSEHMCQLTLNIGFRVAAMNQKKKLYFHLVTYWHEGLFLPRLW